MEPTEPKSQILNLNKPWSDNHNPIWLASSIGLQRNIEKFKFANKLDPERKKQIITLAGRELLTLEPLKQASLLKAEELSGLEKEYLVEHFLSIHSFHQAGAGEAFLIDRNGEMMVYFNIHDHICFLAIDIHGNFEEAWNHLVKIESNLGKSASFSYSPKFGFLTADPAKCGTGLTVMLYLQLSALIHSEKIDAYLEMYSDENALITGIQGNPTDLIGDIVVIQNNYSLGLTEESILSSMRSLGTKLMQEESNLREELRKNPDPEIMDRVSRAFAILRHSYQIEAVEALNAISLLKLGIAANWIEGVSSDELNQLFFNCRRAHLIGQFNGKINQAEIPHKRAEFIHNALKHANLII